MPALTSLAERAADLCSNPTWAEHPGMTPVLALVQELAAQCQQQAAYLLHLGDEHVQSQQELACLREENADPSRQLHRHSGNSGQPPSQDILRKPSPSAAHPRPNGGRQSRQTSGQPGHQNKTLQAIPSKDVHQVANHWPPVCRDCGLARPHQDDGLPLRRQVYNLPEPQPLTVTEHVTYCVVCPVCHTRPKASFPDGVTAPTQYGSGLAAASSYLRYQQHLPVARLRKLLCDLFGVHLATGTVENLCLRVVHGLLLHLKALKQAALALPLACLVETSLRVDGCLVWLHTLCIDQVTYYGNLPYEVMHAFCQAHLLRNLEEVFEQEGEENRWAAAMQALQRESQEMPLTWFGQHQQVDPYPGLEGLKALRTALLDPVIDPYENQAPPYKGGPSPWSQPSSGPVPGPGGLSVALSAAGRVLNLQPGGVGPARDWPADEVLGMLPHQRPGQALHR